MRNLITIISLCYAHRVSIRHDDSLWYVSVYAMVYVEQENILLFTYEPRENMVHFFYLFCFHRIVTVLRMAHFAGNVFFEIDRRLLQKDVKRAFILCQRMASHSRTNTRRSIINSRSRTYLLINSSNPLRLSSMKSSSKMPSWLRRNAGTCRCQALPGRLGTTIYLNENIKIAPSHLVLLYYLVPILCVTIRNLNNVDEQNSPLDETRVDSSVNKERICRSS